MKTISLLLLMASMTLLGCNDAQREKPDTLVDGGYNVDEMDAAIARARREVDSFIEELNNPTGYDHAVKAPIEDNGEVEHFWLSDVVYKDGVFTGTINNDPGIVTNVTFGQSWSVKRDEISDWMFTRDEKIHGNYTMIPLLKTLPPDEAAMYRSMLANPDGN